MYLPMLVIQKIYLSKKHILPCPHQNSSLGLTHESSTRQPPRDTEQARKFCRQSASTCADIPATSTEVATEKKSKHIFHGSCAFQKISIWHVQWAMLDKSSKIPTILTDEQQALKILMEQFFSPYSNINGKTTNHFTYGRSTDFWLHSQNISAKDDNHLIYNDIFWLVSL